MKINSDKTVNWLSIYQNFLSLKEKRNNSAKEMSTKSGDVYTAGEEKNYSYKNITSRMAVIEITNTTKRK